MGDMQHILIDCMIAVLIKSNLPRTKKSERKLTFIHEMTRCYPKRGKVHMIKPIVETLPEEKFDKY